MDALNIEILNQKAMRFIIRLQDLNLIRITKQDKTEQQLIAPLTDQISSNLESKLWDEFSSSTFFKNYGENEPNYTTEDIIEPIF